MFSIRRSFAFTVATLFVLSWIFPIAAGLSRNTEMFPAWWGTVDVVLAFVLAIAAFAIQGLVRARLDKQAEETTYRFYRSFTHVILALALLVMLVGDRVRWVNCATGFLWRTWLLLYILPWWLIAARAKVATAPES